MSSSVSHSIKNRKEANDVFITPLELSKAHIDFIPEEYKKTTDTWLDPCKNSGSYFDQFPEGVIKNWCEVLDDRDFFDCQCNPTVIIQNPPYSIMDKWIKKNIELQPKCCSFLIGLGNLTARRIEMFEVAGYKLTKMKMLKVFKWYGMSVLVNFEKTTSNSIIEIDRKVYK